MGDRGVDGVFVGLMTPSGSGKEPAARAVAAMLGAHSKPRSLLAHNAARFASSEEASATLFGVAKRIFSNVDSRAGLIEEALGRVKTYRWDLELEPEWVESMDDPESAPSFVPGYFVGSGLENVSACVEPGRYIVQLDAIARISYNFYLSNATARVYREYLTMGTGKTLHKYHRVTEVHHGTTSPR